METPRKRLSGAQRREREKAASAPDPPAPVHRTEPLAGRWQPPIPDASRPLTTAERQTLVCHAIARIRRQLREADDQKPAPGSLESAAALARHASERAAALAAHLDQYGATRCPTARAPGANTFSNGPHVSFGLVTGRKTAATPRQPTRRKPTL